MKFFHRYECAYCGKRFIFQFRSLHHVDACHRDAFLTDINDALQALLDAEMAE